MCPSLPDPANGEVQASDRSFGRVATYSCNEGYALMGSNSRRCQADASWSGEEPECEAIIETTMSGLESTYVHIQLLHSVSLEPSNCSISF